MNYLNKYIKGDKKIWFSACFLMIISVPFIYSSATNLVNSSRDVTTFGILMKHIVSIVAGFCIMYISHNFNYRYYKKMSKLLLGICIILLFLTLLQGGAGRWFEIPFIKISFQPSILSKYVLVIYCCSVLSRFKKYNNIGKKHFIKLLFLPMICICSLIFPSDFSTSFILFITILIIFFMEGRFIKYLLIMLSIPLLIVISLYTFDKLFPNSVPHRLDTVKSRIEKFFSVKDSYQLKQAKIAIKSGGIFTYRPGKSVQKNFLPQSTSDFIFPIIVEEYGLLGGVVVIFFYILLLWRFLTVAHRSKDMYARLLVSGIGFLFVFQAFTNMGVSVGLLPITGQQLPFISSGMTSIFVLSWVIGIIINISHSNNEEKE